MIRSITYILLLTFSLAAFSHPWKPEEYVIVETDGSIDDYRALNLLMASSSVRILGIIASDGVLPAKTTYKKVKQLLDLHNQQGLLTGIATGFSDPNIQADSFSKEFNWGESDPGSTQVIDYSIMLDHIMAQTNSEITYLAFSDLTAIENYLNKNSSVIERIHEIVCASDIIDDKEMKSISTLLSRIDNAEHKPALNLVLNCKSCIPVNPWQEATGNNNHSYAHAFFSTISGSKSDVFRAELAVVFVHHPALFKVINAEDYTLAEVNPDFENEIGQSLSNILAGETNLQNQVFKTFMTDSTAYLSDVHPLIETAIEKYGYQEWAACVLTSELHRHLGIYALIGAKMGIRALEYFGAGVDEMKVVSYAGSIPPFSCLNDGLQVSTGATVGHGLISVSDDPNIEPKADFEYLGTTIRLTLKKDYKQKIKEEVKELSMLYGLDSDLYWDLLRGYALGYWKNWDRREIFDVEVLSTL